MGLEPASTYIAALHVIQDHRDDRRPPHEKRPNDGHRTENAHQKAEGV
jgi:hypothetical protein